MTTSLDFTLRDDRFIPSDSAVMNQVLAVVHRHIVSSMKVLGLDTTLREQEVLHVALPGAVSAGEDVASLGRRIVITGHEGVVSALEGNEQFLRLTRFYFRKSTADDRAATLAPEDHVFVATQRKTGTLAENQRKLRRLRKRAEARGGVVPANVIAHLSEAEAHEPRPSILVKSGSTGGLRSRVLDIQPRHAAPRSYDLWGFALPAVAA